MATLTVFYYAYNVQRSQNKLLKQYDNFYNAYNLQCLQFTFVYNVQCQHLNVRSLVQDSFKHG